MKISLILIKIAKIPGPTLKKKKNPKHQGKVFSAEAKILFKIKNLSLGRNGTLKALLVL